MNPLTNVKNIKKLSETELKYNISGKASWHYQYKDSAWIFIGGLPYDLSEGDVICIFSQYGEVANINLVRDKVTGKSKGFCFLCYEDQRSTILAVDNLNSIKVCGRTLRVDHVEQYKIPKDPDKLDEDQLRILQEGCGPESSVVKTLVNSDSNQIATPLPETKAIKVEKVHEERRGTEKRRSRSPIPRYGADRKHSDHRQRSPDHRQRSRDEDRSLDREQRSRDQDRSKKDKKKDKERSERREKSRERSRDRDRHKDRRHPRR